MNQPPSTTEGPTVPHAAAAAPGPARLPTLSLLFDPVEGHRNERASLVDQRIVLGRRCRLFPGGRLRDPEISRDHAELRRIGPDRWLICDLGSTNGTWVEAQRVPAGGSPLVGGELLRLGNTLLLFHFGLDPRPPADALPPLLGDSDAVRQLRAALRRHAPAQQPILLLGPSGCGKELAARALHELSGRAGAFVPVDCGALGPETLVDAALFGHHRGSYTGAHRDSLGLFRTAADGTLFLDEVANLPADFQVKLLRVLDSGQIRPLGSSQLVSVRFRLVAATNADLLREINCGRFRPDLYGRLAGTTIRLPSLFERREDLPLLIRAFLEQQDPAAILADPQQPVPEIESETMATLLQHTWPLNIRELRQVVQELTRSAAGGGRWQLSAALAAELAHRRRELTEAPVGPSDRPEAETRAPQLAAPRPPARSGPLRKATLEAALAQHQGNISAVARQLERDRAQVYRTIQQLGLDLARFRSAEQTTEEEEPP